MSNPTKKLEAFNKIIDVLTSAKSARSSIEEFATKIFEDKNNLSKKVNVAIDYAASQSETWREDFNRAFNQEMGIKEDFEYLKLLSDEAKNVQAENFDKAQMEYFDVTAEETGSGKTALRSSNLISTNILTAGDAYFRKYSQLFKYLRVITGVDTYRIPEFGIERTDAAKVAESAEGTGADDVARQGDVLIPGESGQKFKSWTRITELALLKMNPVDWGTMQARILRGLEKTLAVQVATGDNAGGNFNDFINSNTGATAFGALTVTFATTGAEKPANHLMAMSKMLKDLPADIDEDEEANYVFLTNRFTRYTLKEVMDLNNNLYTNEKTNKLTSLIDNLPILQWPGLTNNQVLLVDLRKYYMLLAKPITIEIEKEVNKETFIVKAVAYADGGMAFGYKTLADGTTANTQKNGHRLGTLKTDYAV